MTGCARGLGGKATRPFAAFAVAAAGAAVSTGEMPDLRGLEEAEAREVMFGRELELDLVVDPPGCPAVRISTIHGQAIDAGVFVPDGSTVTAWAAPLVTVPPLVGLDEEDARARLAASCLILEAVDAAVGDEIGPINEQKPLAGTVVPADTLVTALLPLVDPTPFEPSDSEADSNEADSESSTDTDGSELTGSLVDPGQGGVLAWWPVPAVLLGVIAAGLAWASRVSRSRQRRWVTDHVRTEAQLGEVVVETTDDPGASPSHAVRIVPRSGPERTTVERVR